MAAKKSSSRAQKAVTDVKRKNTASSTSTSVKKTSSGSRKALPTAVPQDNRLPVRFILAAVSAGLFILFLVIGIKPDGALLRLFQSILFGLIGKVGFYFSIPALLYLFLILVTSGKNPVKARSFCLNSFVLLCGCMAQWGMDASGLPKGADYFKALYAGGVTGKTSGIIGGLVTLTL